MKLGPYAKGYYNADKVHGPSTLVAKGHNEPLQNHINPCSYHTWYLHGPPYTIRYTKYHIPNTIYCICTIHLLLLESQYG